MLIAGARVKDIARAVGVHPDTVSHWRSEPEFKAALEEAQKDVVSRAKNVLVRAAEEAVEQVLACMREGAEDQRLRAALAILDRVGLVAGAKIEHTGTVNLAALSEEELLRKLDEARNALAS
ncbi:MAG: transposase [Polyangiaceae bacterium]|nr:transposase [Polyangiaceae bacterium]